MNKVMNELEPKEVWRFFKDILAIPRPSKKEEKIIAYLLDFARERSLSAERDEIGNVLIRKEATKGMEGRPWVCLQCHSDMVCEKNTATKFDFESDAIEVYKEGDWLKARGTTMGADDGIGMAAALAVLDSKDLVHGPLECLFTVDEETGLSGAFAIKEGFLKSKILLNLDSEDEGEIFIGCAGGIDTLIRLPYNKEPLPKNHIGYKISVSGLKGGHSGDDINKGLANANQLLNRLLWNADKEIGICIQCFDGGNLRNAIAREAYAVLGVEQGKEQSLINLCHRYFQVYKEEFCTTEPSLKVEIGKVEPPAFVINSQAQFYLLNSLLACPHGVLAMSKDIPNFVETSTNLASVKMDESFFIISTSQRSSLESAKLAAAQKVASCFLLAHAEIIHSEGYPGWKPNPQSPILACAVQTYMRLFGKEPLVRAIHAGLECGLIGEKYPGMDMISFGPTLRGVHSPDERIEIATVELFWKHLLEILKSV